MADKRAKRKFIRQLKGSGDIEAVCCDLGMIGIFETEVII
jgi:hypothetical protein